ncbi:MAG: PilZ domain-containing protein [Candidatus Omnitrophica bacterium]|nr:PilZ domain-containing protein [Candidatus Omnitrophota bacterium]
MDNVIFDYRRKVKRKPCFLASGFILYNKAPVLAGYEDVSVSGAGILTNGALQVNGQVTLALNTRRKGLVLVDGKVCWCQRVRSGWRSGIAFNRVLSFEPTIIV